MKKTKMVRTTITLPRDLFDRLKSAAFFRKKTVSGLMRDGISKIVNVKKVAPGEGLMNLRGKYPLAGKAAVFDRKAFYDKPDK